MNSRRSMSSTGLLPQFGALGASNDHQPGDGPQPCRQELRRRRRCERGSHLDAEKSFSPRGGIVEVERTKHLYQADELFGLGIKGAAGAWRLAELIDLGRSQ